MTRSVLVPLIVICSFPASSRAQTAYLSGLGGISAGDGGAAPAIVVAAGYLTPRRIGFEVEFGYIPDLELPGPDVRILATESFPIPVIYPPIFFENSGRLLTMHTNAVFQLTSTGQLRLFAIGGGGVASVEQRTRIRRDPIVLEAPFPVVLPLIRTDFTTSETALSLNLGGAIEYAWTERLGVGVDARYGHVFLSQNGLDLARITGRVTWRF